MVPYNRDIDPMWALSTAVGGASRALYHNAIVTSLCSCKTALQQPYKEDAQWQGIPQSKLYRYVSHLKPLFKWRNFYWPSVNQDGLTITQPIVERNVVLLTDCSK